MIGRVNVSELPTTPRFIILLAGARVSAPDEVVTVGVCTPPWATVRFTTWNVPLGTCVKLLPNSKKGTPAACSVKMEALAPLVTPPVPPKNMPDMLSVKNE